MDKTLFIVTELIDTGYMKLLHIAKSLEAIECLQNQLEMMVNTAVVKM